jgi:hypothetical protein
MASIPIDQRGAVPFDASRWLAAWAEHGGIYMLLGTQVHLRRARALDPSSLAQLDILRREMFRSGGGPAIADLLFRRRSGDIA